MHLVHPRNLSSISVGTTVTPRIIRRKQWSRIFFWGGGGGAMGIMVYVKMVNNKLLDT